MAIQPVVIPALKPTLDPSLVQDKSLCPVRALRYYLDKTKDLRKGKPPRGFSTMVLGVSFATKTINGVYWRGHMTIGGLPSPHSLTGFLRYLKNISQHWPVSWMAPTYSIGQEMVSIYLIKIKITTKFFKFLQCLLRIVFKKDRGKVLFVAILWQNGTTTITVQNEGII